MRIGLPEALSPTENQFSGKTYFYTIGPWSAAAAAVDGGVTGAVVCVGARLVDLNGEVGESRNWMTLTQCVSLVISTDVRSSRI